MWVVEATIGIPPPTETVTGKCTGIMTRSQLNIADIASYIIEAVWNDHPFSKAIEIMIIGSQCFQRIQMAFAIEVAHIFLLLGIHTDNRIPGSFILSFQTLNVFKLLIAVWHRFHGLLLVRLPATIVVLLQQFAHHRLTDGNPMVHLERCANLSHRQICPADGRIHRVARRMVMENVQKLLVDVDPRLLIRFAASAGNPNASIHFGLGQLADFFGAFAHRPTTKPTPGQCNFVHRAHTGAPRYRHNGVGLFRTNSRKIASYSVQFLAGKAPFPYPYRCSIDYLFMAPEGYSIQFYRAKWPRY